jgi:hypothetical protein
MERTGVVLIYGPVLWHDQEESPRTSLSAIQKGGPVDRRWEPANGRVYVLVVPMASLDPPVGLWDGSYSLEVIRGSGWGVLGRLEAAHGLLQTPDHTFGPWSYCLLVSGGPDILIVSPCKVTSGSMARVSEREAIPRSEVVHGPLVSWRFFCARSQSLKPDLEPPPSRLVPLLSSRYKSRAIMVTHGV